ncbi:hypothetical protein CPB97_000428, partial [Podila verticillata]
MSDSGDSSDSEVYIPRDPVVPAPVSGPRARKQVERYAAERAIEKEEKKIVIPQGKGVKLSEIPTVNSNLDKLKNTDETIKGLHRVLFGRATTIKNPKANLKEFNGFADLTEKEEEHIEEKFGKWTVAGLRDLIELFNLEAGGDKDAVLENLMVFLKKPKDSGLLPRAQKIALEAKEKKAKKLALKKAKLVAKAEKAAALKAKKSEQKKLEAKKKAAAAKAAAASKKEKAAKATKAPKATSSSSSSKIPKIRSDFDMYTKEHSKEIKASLPAEASRADIYKKLVDKWEATDVVVRESYQAKADAENAKNAEKKAKADQEAKKEARKEKKAQKEVVSEEKPKKEKAAKVEKKEE